ncbi:MAG: hypothetical protein NVSMB25_06730 [Thermoleophilaceae bacterium]
MHSRVIGTVVAVVIGVLSSILAAPALAAGPPAQAAAKQGKLHMVVQVNRFLVRHRRTVAQGTVSTNLTDLSGRSTQLKSPVMLSVSRSGSCQVLNLDLNELTLTLLGLNVHLDRVKLVVTGQPRGGVLGSLFCRLAHARIAGGPRAAAAAKTLNANIRNNPLRPLSFTVPLSPKVAVRSAATTCPVLDLVLGPLNLNLLGLVVDLQKVHLTITAARGQGALGDLFCTLADQPR